jgi:hypothetical protein
MTAAESQCHGLQEELTVAGDCNLKSLLGENGIDDWRLLVNFEALLRTNTSATTG